MGQVDLWGRWVYGVRSMGRGSGGCMDIWGSAGLWGTQICGAPRIYGARGSMGHIGIYGVCGSGGGSGIYGARGSRGHLGLQGADLWGAQLWGARIYGAPGYGVRIYRDLWGRDLWGTGIYSAWIMGCGSMGRGSMGQGSLGPTGRCPPRVFATCGAEPWGGGCGRWHLWGARRVSVGQSRGAEPT